MARDNKVRVNKTRVRANKVNAARVRDRDRKVTWDHKVAGIKTQALNKAAKAEWAVSKTVADSKDKAAWAVKEVVKADKVVKVAKAAKAAALVVAWVPDKEGTIYKVLIDLPNKSLRPHGRKDLYFMNVLFS